MDEKINKLLQKITYAAKEGTYNMYLMKYNGKNTFENKVIALPEAKVVQLAEDICASIKNWSNAGVEFRAFDPTYTEEGVCEKVKLKEVEKQWSKIMQMISEENYRANNKEEGNKVFEEANFTILDLVFEDEQFYICLTQNSSGSFLKGKKIYKQNEGKLTTFKAKGIVFLSDNPDFIISKDQNEEYIYIINKKNFIKFFNYDEHVLESVKANISKIKDIQFVKSFEFIEKNIEKKYVYQGLGRIINDSDYIESMKKTTARSFKKRLLKNCPKTFNDNCFDDNDRLIVERSNLHMFIKAITKQLRYNFFTDQAENN